MNRRDFLKLALSGALSAAQVGRFANALEHLTPRASPAEVEFMTQPYDFGYSLAVALKAYCRGEQYRMGVLILGYGQLSNKEKELAVKVAERALLEWWDYRQEKLNAEMSCWQYDRT